MTKIYSFDLILIKIYKTFYALNILFENFLGGNLNMSGKWYPKLTEVLEDTTIIFDTSALLNVYRYSLVNSKRILNHIKNHQDKIWIPAQVKKEFYRNKEKVRSVNLYKNLDSKLTKQVETKKDELLVQLSDYEKKRFSKFPELKKQLEAKFLEMNTIIKNYKEEISEETGVYKDFIQEVDNFLDSLLNNEKVGGDLNLIELMELLKEGELRYKYNLPPGYEDAKTKEGIEQFGDLIMWKQILKKSSDIDNKYIVFVTSDTKPDWFHKNKQDEVISPREELLSEFNQIHPKKEAIILPFEVFIEELSDSSDPSDRDLLLELRTNNLIKRLPQDSFRDIVEEKLKLVDIDELVTKTLQLSNVKEKYYIKKLADISSPNVKNILINANGISLEESEVIYSLKVVANCEYQTVSLYSNILSYGVIHTEMTLSVELKRSLEDSETSFIKKFRENSSDISTVTHYTLDKVNYIWEGDDDHLLQEIDEDEADFYSTCPECGNGINFDNDAGNGFCIHCSK